MATHRFAIAPSLVAVALLAAVLAAPAPALTQDAATPPAGSSPATHPVVGAWDMTTVLDGNTFPFLAIFHGDGTYMEIYPWGAIFIGGWHPTGARTAEGRAVGYEIIDDRIARGEGRFTAEVDETGNAIDTDGNFVNRFEDGSVEPAVEGPAPGVRLPVLPVLPLDALVGTPTAGPSATAEVSPAP